MASRKPRQDPPSLESLDTERKAKMDQTLASMEALKKSNESSAITTHSAMASLEASASTIEYEAIVLSKSEASLRAVMALDEQEVALRTALSENPIRPGTQEMPSEEVQQVEISVEMQGEGVERDLSQPCLYITVPQNVPQIVLVRQPSDVEMSATLVQPIQEGEQADQLLDSQLVPPSASFVLPLADPESDRKTVDPFVISEEAPQELNQAPDP